jgi:hypothetical protein
MTDLLRSRITLVWVILVGATMLSWEMGHGAFDDLRYARVAVIVVGFIKVRYVILDFMEIRHAPWFIRLVGESWVVVVCVVLIALYL